MMLSRVADSLYWMGRYLERAEHTSRVVDVTLDLMPDRSEEDNRRAWYRAFTGLRLPEPDYGAHDAQQLTHLLTFDRNGSGSVSAYIASARENARQVRDHISPEMWEQLNHLFLNVQKTNIEKIWRDQPHEFFQMIKQGTHLFRGITDSTMYHGEGWYFIQVGQFLERASDVAALLNAYLLDTPSSDQEVASTGQYVDWAGLLRSCTALEAYCKVYTADTRLDYIAEFLLLNGEFPHSVHFAVNTMRVALNEIAKATSTPNNAPVNRQIGRLKAALDYDQIDDVLSSDLHTYLGNIQQQCAQIHDVVYRIYVDYPVDQRLAG